MEMQVIPFEAIAAAAQAMDRGVAGKLLVLREQLQAAMNVPEEAIAFLVPPHLLIGVTHLCGSVVVHNADVQRPAVVIAADGW